MTGRVLVTGASGFIGRHAIPELAERGYEIHAVSRRPLPGGVIHHLVDLANDVQVRDMMRAVAPSHLLHLAWDVTPGAFWSSPANLDWVASSLRLYRAFAEHGGRRAVFAGSCAEYDWSGGPLDEETTPLQPATLYGAAKCALRDLIVRSAETDGISIGWARLFMLYGPHEREARLVPYVARALLRGEPALCGDGRAERDFMHVADVAAALVTLLDSGYQGAVNIASGNCVALAEIIATIAALTGRGDLVRLGARPATAGEPLRLAAAATLLQQVGFRPRFRLTEGLANTVDWWRHELAAAP